MVAFHPSLPHNPMMAAHQGITLSEAQRLLLREARQLLGLSLQHVADKVGVSDAAIIRYEQGRSRPSLGVLERWAKVLGYKVTVGELKIRPIKTRKKR